uniref:Uncharacterized protein n=1 Tax=viral metagenome TaxID=1070528 RepID=A0A6M3IMY1_9ZZZZ
MYISKHPPLLYFIIGAFTVIFTVILTFSIFMIIMDTRPIIQEDNQTHFYQSSSRIDQWFDDKAKWLIKVEEGGEENAKREEGEEESKKAHN